MIPMLACSSFSLRGGNFAALSFNPNSPGDERFPIYGIQ